jgi:hypothetical protein
MPKATFGYSLIHPHVLGFLPLWAADIFAHTQSTVSVLKETKDITKVC